MKHISDVQGVLFAVEYFGSPPEIQSVHLLDADYSPVGPDLTFLLHGTLLLIADTSDAERFLSKLVEDLPCPSC